MLAAELFSFCSKNVHEKNTDISIKAVSSEYMLQSDNEDESKLETKLTF